MHKIILADNQAIFRTGTAKVLGTWKMTVANHRTMPRLPAAISCDYHISRRHCDRRVIDAG